MTLLSFAKRQFMAWLKSTQMKLEVKPDKTPSV